MRRAGGGALAAKGLLSRMLCLPARTVSSDSSASVFYPVTSCCNVVWSMLAIVICVGEGNR